MNIGYVTPSKDKKEKYIKRYMEMKYFRRADEHRYYDLQRELLIASEYPKTLQIAYDIIHRHTPSITDTYHRRKNCRGNVNVMFTQCLTSKYQGNSQGQKQLPGTDERITEKLFLMQWIRSHHTIFPICK